MDQHNMHSQLETGMTKFQYITGQKNKCVLKTNLACLVDPSQRFERGVLLFLLVSFFLFYEIVSG